MIVKFVDLKYLKRELKIKLLANLLIEYILVNSFTYSNYLFNFIDLLIILIAFNLFILINALFNLIILI